MRILQGSPEELKRFMDLEAAQAVVDDRPKGTEPPADIAFLGDYEGGLMSAEVAFRCISRKPALPETMLGIITMLDRQYPTPVSGADLAKKLGLSLQQLTGVFGAFGRRCANTEGFNSKQAHFFKFTGKPGDWSYSLTDQTLAAVREFLKRRK